MSDRVWQHADGLTFIAEGLLKLAFGAKAPSLTYDSALRRARVRAGLTAKPGRKTADGSASSGADGGQNAS